MKKKQFSLLDMLALLLVTFFFLLTVYNWGRIHRVENFFITLVCSENDHIAQLECNYLKTSFGKW